MNVFIGIVIVVISVLVGLVCWRAGGADRKLSSRFNGFFIGAIGTMIVLGAIASVLFD